MWSLKDLCGKQTLPKAAPGAAVLLFTASWGCQQPGGIDGNIIAVLAGLTLALKTTHAWERPAKQS